MHLIYQWYDFHDFSIKQINSELVSIAGDYQPSK